MINHLCPFIQQIRKNSTRHIKERIANKHINTGHIILIRDQQNWILLNKSLTCQAFQKQLHLVYQDF